MLRFLLDEHLSPDIAAQVNRCRPDIAITSLQAFREGALLGADDATILLAACEECLTLVTYDRRTIWPLLQGWGEQGTSHAGIVFVNRGAFASHDIGGLVRALAALWDAQEGLDWTDRAIYL